MKIRYAFGLVMVAGLAAAGGWWMARIQSASKSSREPAAVGSRKVLFYQSSMHPWIKSDKPGKCTICGMPLTPVYEGEKGLDSGHDFVALSANSINVARVRTEPVTRQQLKKTLRVSGVMEDDDSRHRRLSAFIEGRIEQLHVQYLGAEVVEGQPLATFHSLPLLGLEREYLSIVRQLSQAPESVRPELDRMRKAAENRLLLMGITRKQIEALPQRKDEDHLSEILAPMSGTVVSKDVYAGQYVKEGDRLFEIADFATMWFKFDAYERDLPWLKLGQAVDVTTPSVPGKVYKASIRFIDPNLSEATRSAKVRVEVPNPLIVEQGLTRRELLHRLYAEGMVDLMIPEVLTVPRSAVLNPNGQPVVYVDKGQGSYQQRKLRLGRRGDSAWEVLEGLEEGEKVVTSGNLLIDSQAQLNAGGSSPAEASFDPSQTIVPASALRPEAELLAKNFLASASDVADALASDDLERFNKEIPRIAESLPPFAAAVSSQQDWEPLISGIQQAARLAPAADLQNARKHFHPFGTAVTAFVKAARRQPSFKAYKIYQCPMTGRSFPGAPKTGTWMQKEGPIRNPYFGADMLDCGSEIKP